MTTGDYRCQCCGKHTQSNDGNSVKNHGEVSRSINKNIEESSSMNDSIKLFSVGSLVYDVRNCREVFVKWSKCGTKFEGFDYKCLIEDYDDLDHYERTLCEKIINEFFTEDECTLLEEYLKVVNKYNCIIFENSFPLVVKVDGWMRYPLSFPCTDSNPIDLSKEEQYSLPFKVLGYCEVFKKE